MTKNFFSTLLIAIVFAVSFIGIGCGGSAEADHHSKLSDRTTVIDGGLVLNDPDHLIYKNAAIAVIQNAGFNEGLQSTADFSLTIHLENNDDPDNQGKIVPRVTIALINDKDASLGAMATSRMKSGQSVIEGIKNMQPELQAEIKRIVAAIKVGAESSLADKSVPTKVVPANRPPLDEKKK